MLIHVKKKSLRDFHNHKKNIKKNKKKIPLSSIYTIDIHTQSSYHGSTTLEKNKRMQQSHQIPILSNRHISVKNGLSRRKTNLTKFFFNTPKDSKNLLIFELLKPKLTAKKERKKRFLRL